MMPSIQNIEKKLELILILVAFWAGWAYFKAIFFVAVTVLKGFQTHTHLLKPQLREQVDLVQDFSLFEYLGTGVVGD